MRVQLHIIPEEPEGADHNLMFDMPCVPQIGDCLTISRSGQSGCTDFVVRRARWVLDYEDVGAAHRVDEPLVGTTNAVMIECEFAVGPYSSEEHKTAAA